jgi:hypothetical protein
MDIKDIIELLKRIPELPGYVLTGWQALRWVVRRFLAWRRRRQPPAPKAIIEHRIRMRKEIDEHIERQPNRAILGEIVIRDLQRMDAFPDISEHDVGPSAWFKVELIGFYHRGIEVFLSDAKKAIPTADADGRWGGWRLLEEGEKSDQAITAWPVGRIPFDFIESVDWSGDEYYGLPHFYCRFSNPFFDPYEEIIYKGKLYPEVSQDYQEMRGLRHAREDWSGLRRFFFRMGHRVRSSAVKFMNRWRRRGRR